MSHILKPAAMMARPQILRRSKVPVDSSAFCSYSHRSCMQPRIDGYDFCTRHILEDKNNPFKQCQYMSHKTNKRCNSAALKADKRESYCTEHARQMSFNRYRTNRKRKPPTTPETLLDELELYGPSRGNHGNSNTAETKKSKISEASKILEYASSSDSEAEALLVDQTWRGDGDSDAESIDSEQEDPLKHAGVYTAEEVALITRDKLIRLQSLYIDQFKRLQHVMKEKRRRYIHTVRGEREALGSIHYAKEDPEQREKYDQLVAMKRYHKRFGQEALLHRQSKERRISVSEGPSYKPPSYPKCIFSRNSGRCGARSVPLTKYCFNHILFDPHQTLFKPCNYARGCRRPVPALFETSSCIYHGQALDIDYRLPRKEEKDESKDEIDVVGGADIKQEEPHQSLQLQIQIQEEQLQSEPGSSKNVHPTSSQLVTTAASSNYRATDAVSSSRTTIPYSSSVDSAGQIVRTSSYTPIPPGMIKAATAATKIVVPHKSKDGVQLAKPPDVVSRSFGSGIDGKVSMSSGYASDAKAVRRTVPIARKPKTTMFKVERKSSNPSSPLIRMSGKMVTAKPMTVLLPAPASTSRVPLVVSDLLAEEATRRRQDRYDPPTKLLPYVASAVASSKPLSSSATSRPQIPDPLPLPAKEQLSQVIPKMVEMTRDSTEDKDVQGKVSGDATPKGVSKELLDQDIEMIDDESAGTPTNVDPPTGSSMTEVCEPVTPKPEKDSRNSSEMECEPSEGNVAEVESMKEQKM